MVLNTSLCFYAEKHETPLKNFKQGSNIGAVFPFIIYFFGRSEEIGLAGRE